MTHTPEFDRWLREHDDIDMVRLAQYSDQIPALDQWIDQNHRNMVQANTAETLKRFEVTPEQQLQAWWDKAITLGRMLLAYAAFVLGALAVVWLATRGGR